MAVKQNTVTVATTATNLVTPKDKFGFEGVARTLILQNGSGVDIFVGDSTVTTTSFGYKLKAGAETAFDLTGDDVLYAVVATGTAALNTLHTGL